MLDKIKYEERGERRIILNLTVLLYNYSCTRIGHNQILSTFMHDKNNYFGYEYRIPVEAETQMFALFQIYYVWSFLNSRNRSMYFK